MVATAEKPEKKGKSFAPWTHLRRDQTWKGHDPLNTEKALPGKNPIPNEEIRRLQELAKDIQYGTITLVFQDGMLVQLERSEKIRIPKSKS